MVESRLGCPLPLHAGTPKLLDQSITGTVPTSLRTVPTEPCRPDSGCKSNAPNFEPYCHINLYCCHPCRFATGCDLKNVAKINIFSGKMFVATNTSVQRGAASLLSSAARYLPAVPTIPICTYRTVPTVSTVPTVPTVTAVPTVPTVPTCTYCTYLYLQYILYILYLPSSVFHI